MEEIGGRGVKKRRGCIKNEMLVKKRIERRRKNEE
jgi:hypothetical protein